MRRQMQLRPSQGGKMRGPTEVERQRVLGERTEQVKAALALLEPDGEQTHESNSLYSRYRNDHVCKCGYVLCACEPVAAPPKVYTHTTLAEPVAESEPEPLRYADGQEVRVGDVYSVRPDSMATYRIAAILGRCVVASSGGGRLLKSAWADAPRHLRRRAAPRVEVGMRVRVKDDATAPSGHRRSMWAGNTGVVTGMYEEGLTEIDYSKRVRLEDLEPIE